MVQICMHTRMYACMYAYTYACMHVYMYICTIIFVFIHVYIMFVFIHMYIYCLSLYMCIYKISTLWYRYACIYVYDIHMYKDKQQNFIITIQACMHTCICMRGLHICTQTCMHTCTETCIHIHDPRIHTST